MDEQDDLPMGEADAAAVPEMDDDEALQIFRQTAFLHTSVKTK